MRTMKWWVLLGAVLCCGLAPARADELLKARFDQPQVLFDGLVAPTEALQHVTVTTISDITQPEAPVELWRGSNVLSLCGILNLLQLGRSGADSNMPATFAAPASVCGGLDALGNLKRAALYGTASSIYVGSANNTACNGNSNPWACCLGAGSGNCNLTSPVHVVTFTEGQPYASIVGLETNYTAWVNATRPNGTLLAVDANNPSAYFDGGTTSGLVWQATADGATANHLWCEYAVKSHRNGTGYGLVNAGPAAPYQSGWALNHAIISPCLSKAATSIWQIRVQITIA